VTGADVIVELRRVRKGYGTAPGSRVEVLSGVDLEVRRGEALAVTGPSGSGKSTLLHLIGALDAPDEGEVLIEGRALATLDPRELARVRNRSIGFIFQFHHLLPQLGVLENVLVPAMVAGDRGAGERAARLLERVGLGHRISHRPGQLSGGECQRVAVVRALINRPALLLADEPTGSLDPRGAQRLIELLAELNREEGTTLVVVTHARELAAHMGRTLEMRDGRLAPPGSP
jgi:lipoprotein-releasing system ATP-binding protein